MRILGTGSFLPAREVSNEEIARTLDTTDEWIYSHTGIRSRHVAADDETTSTMAVRASRAALEMAATNPGEIGLVVCATSSPDYNTFPSTACLLQGELGCEHAGAYDLQAACAGFIYALEMARGFVALHPDQKVLVVGAETLSRIVDWTDRGSCILFGDGAGAVVVGEGAGLADTPTQVILGADGKGAHFITRSGGVRGPQPKETPNMNLKGHEVFAFAVRTLARTVENLCAREGIKPADLDFIFAHQANRRIIEATARRIGLPLSKFFLNLETTANTSAASIPIAIDQAVRSGTLADGMKIAFVGFGAGLTYGGISCVWPNL